MDLDNTILNVNSGKVLVQQAFKNGMINSAKFIHAVYLSFLYKLNFKKTELLIEKMPAWLSGIEEIKMIAFCNTIFNEQLIHHIHPLIYSEIEKHRRKSACLVMLSGALNYICQPVAEHLQFDDIICSQVIVNDGFFSGKEQGLLCFGKEKLQRARTWCSVNNFLLEKAWYYADSMADFDVLNVVKHPRCINPDPKLARIAAKKEWPVYMW